MQSNTPVVVPSLIGIGMGIPFGMAFYTSRTYHPETIKAQLAFENWDMFKTFMSAVSVGGACVLAMHSTSDIALTSKPHHALMTPLGGLLLGGGMYLSGACPGTIWAQLGSGMKGAVSILAGAVSASVCFAFVKEYLPAGSPGLFIHSDVLHVSYESAAISIFGGIAVTLAALEYLQYSKTKKINWRPYLAGALIGSLQILSMRFVNTGLGTSSALLTVPATLLRLCGITNPTILKFTSYSKNYWQVGLDMGILLGSYIISRYSPDGKSRDNRNTTLTNFMGGFLLAFGARLAGGCTSGHGLTGMANLSVTSLVAVPAMFAGGMLSSYLFK